MHIDIYHHFLLFFRVISRNDVHRGIDGGKNLPKEFLEYLYTSTVTHEIKILPGASSAPAEGESYPVNQYCM